ncbi:MAG: hypothetical protein AAGF98_00720 [Cyanobacteria bacterium P01_H01_bin.153]
MPIKFENGFGFAGTGKLFAELAIVDIPGIGAFPEPMSLVALSFFGVLGVSLRRSVNREKSLRIQ